MIFERTCRNARQIVRVQKHSAMTQETILFALISFRSMLASSLDYSGVGSIIAAITAAVALYFGHKSNRRSANNTEEVSYVENNLKTMQATLDWVTKENERLRELNEDQRTELDKISNELRHIEIKLDKCTRSYELVKKRLNELGEQNGR